MRISVVAMGSRGDVQPMVVLADELRSRGHDVTLGVPPDLVSTGTSAGLVTYGVGPDIQPLFAEPEVRAAIASNDIRTYVRRMSTTVHDAMPQLLADMTRVCAGADAIVAGIIADEMAMPCAEAADIPFFALHLTPYRASSAHPPPMLTSRSMPGFLNLAGGYLFQILGWASFRGELNGLRRQLGMAPTWRPTVLRMHRRGDRTLQAFHSIVVPNLPRRAAAPIVGYFSVPAHLRKALDGAALSEDLVDWIDSGEPPVYLGFGSMPVTDTRILDIVRTASQRLGIRFLVSSGWSCVGSASDDRVRVVSKVDHSQVFPRCRAVVHHGGAGTTAAGLTAGVPAVVCSVFFDQPFWGNRVERLGAGVHLPFKNLSVASFSAALKSAMEPAKLAAAAGIGSSLRADRPGQWRAADLIEAARPVQRSRGSARR